MQSTKLIHASCNDLFYAEDTFVHSSAVVGPQVTLGNGVKIGAGVVIDGVVTIGAGTKIYPYTVIGSTAQDRSTRVPLGKVEIGALCEIREFVTIHAPKKPDGVTRLGNNCYIMNYAHVSHDATLEDNVTMNNQAQIGGHTHLEQGVIMMAGSATHQFCRVGAYTAVAPYSGTRQDLPPFCLFDGRPARFVNLNLVGLKRLKIDAASLEQLRHITRLFYAQKESIECLKSKLENFGQAKQGYAEAFINFIEKSARGVSRRTICDERKHVKVSRWSS